MSGPEDPGSSYTVLRIKRKATEPPLSSLVIENAVGHGRNKKRKEDGKSRGIFRLADTVPDTWQGQGSEGDVLRRRIKGLLETRHDRPSSDGQHKNQPANSNHPVPKPADAGPSRPAMPTQYRVIPKVSAAASGLPPRVMTNEELNAAALKLLDAEAVSSSSRSTGPPPSGPVADPEEEKEMAAFLPMLQEYLKLEGSSSLEPPTSSQDQYVYDLYYRDIRPSLSSTPLGLGLGDGVSVGALLGYQEDELDSEPSESEPEDEADEDSNDEDYYRNDYPEDEDADEDMRGFKDAFGGEGESESEQGSPEDRNRSLWSYR